MISIPCFFSHSSGPRRSYVSSPRATVGNVLSGKGSRIRSHWLSLNPCMSSIAGNESHFSTKFEIGSRACSHYPQPIGDEREIDEGDEHEVELLESGEDTTEALESTEQPFDLIAPLVHFPVVFPRCDSRLLGWNDGDKSEIKRQLPGLITFVCTVHDEMQRPRRPAELA